MTGDIVPVHDLTPAEQDHLRHLEGLIGPGLETFVLVGEALAEIRDLRLYGETHRTFEDYCGERWGISKRHANRTIASARTARELGPNGPTTEAVARELATLPPRYVRRRGAGRSRPRRPRAAS